MFELSFVVRTYHSSIDSESNATQAVKMADSLCKRTPLPEGSGFTLPAGVEPLPEIEKYRTTVSLI